MKYSKDNYFCTVLSMNKLNYTPALMTFVVENHRKADTPVGLPYLTVSEYETFLCENLSKRKAHQMIGPGKTPRH